MKYKQLLNKHQWRDCRSKQADKGLGRTHVKLVSDLKTVQHETAIGGNYNWYHSWYYQSPGTTINGTKFTNINGCIIQYYNETAKWKNYL